MTKVDRLLAEFDQRNDLAGTLSIGPVKHFASRQILTLTGALALACAAVVDGSVVNACISKGADPLNLRIGTPSGIVTVGATRDPESGVISVARILRTQRRLMDGHIYVPHPAANPFAQQD